MTIVFSNRIIKNGFSTEQLMILAWMNLKSVGYKIVLF